MSKRIPSSDSCGLSSLAGELPEDVLRHIFTMALPLDRLEEDLTICQAQTVRTPLHLSHVSRHWRGVSLLHRELWSFLTLSLDIGHRETFPAIVEIFDVFLARTRGCPLNFFVRCTLQNEEDDVARNHVEQVLAALLKEQHRWRDMVLHVDRLKLTSGSPSFRIKNMPLLRSLKLHVLLKAYVDEKWKPHYAIIDISQSSQIESLSLSGDYDLIVGEAQKHELLQCTLIPDQEPSNAWCARMCMDILTHTPNLWKLDLRNRYCYHPYPLFEADPLVHNLKKLRLQYGLSGEMILDFLDLPELKELYYSDNLVTLMSSSAHKTLEFLQRSRPVLTSLTIHGVIISKVTVLAMLQLQPALIELDLRLGLYSMNSVLRALDLRKRKKGRNNTTVLCPSLRTLRIIGRNLSYDWYSWRSLNALLPMIKSRYRAMGTFNHILVRLREENLEASAFTRKGFGFVKAMMGCADYYCAETVEDPEDRHLARS